MKSKDINLISLFEKTLQQGPQHNLEEIGIVVQVGDGICTIFGLTNAVYGELIKFEGGNEGIVLNLNEDFVIVFLFKTSIAVVEQEVATRAGHVVSIPAGNQMLGRVVNALGEPIDALGDITPDAYMPVEAQIPSIIDRTPITESMPTGIMVIDALFPIGKGQRELIIGNRSTGKTAVAIDAILNQKGKDVICVYVSIGQRQGNIARLVRLLEEQGALEYTVVVNADSSEAVLNQYLVPYSGTAIGEYFMQQGKDVLIIYDDLSNHAIAYREMSLLMRRAPGREAYPGDVFYLHSRLLERSGRLLSGGSMTALPIIQIQSDDITAYIPTNLISITDGQIFLDTQLFNSGIRPAVNVELSVSRVGGAAQTKAVKKMTSQLRLELAQYHELLSFAQFGTELDEVSQMYLKQGALAVEILKQGQFVHYSFIDESLILFLLKEGFLKRIALKDVQLFIRQFVSYVESVYETIYTQIRTTKDISAENIAMLKDVAKEFSSIFISDDKFSI
ncbi:F0F1 ATP synthase subunit alpha [Candidatus Chromulinivorax destructor]|uniref:ATP synthase subunit alpha n=1 Tax=Candidatus Chromulinivorax destructor TaxID=2066483 RepID=A0A345ZD24_9BACT|nr:F0F1 ATP synthase subunit alpha [Candidatus Chromulinivorax destructor]AXK61191.1 F0F1 ATP synthase subunit alpha [Candidatus Chromulinivorax destructor]